MHVVCAGRVLVTIPLSAWLATNGFIKGVVVGISGRLGYVADFRCKRCLEGDSAPVVLLSEVDRVRARCEGGVGVQILLFGGHTRFWWRCSGSGLELE